MSLQDLIKSFGDTQIHYLNTLYKVSEVKADYFTLERTLDPGVVDYVYIPFTGVSRITLHSNRGVQSITVHTDREQG
jgi:hypothetical protein